MSGKNNFDKQMMKTENAAAMLRAIDNSGVRTFMYYPQTKSIIVPEKTCDAYGCRAEYDNMPHSFADDYVHPDDWEAFKELYYKIDRGTKTATAVFHSKDNKFCNEVTLTTISRTENGLPMETFGIIENVKDYENNRALVEELQKQIREKFAGESENLETINRIATSIGGIYYAIYHVNLQDNTFTCFREEALRASVLIGKSGTYDTGWVKYVENFVLPEYREEMLEFGDYKTLADRLKDVSFISRTYRRAEFGWIRAQFIAAEHDDMGNVTKTVLTVRDINEEIELEEQKKQAMYEAEHDPLTGLYNRKAFERISVSEQFTERSTGIAIIDIDNFKAMNDCHGHDMGDHVLTAVASELTRVFRSEDRVFRMGGDEIAVLIYNCGDNIWDIACNKMKTVHSTLAKAFSEGLDVDVTLSMGLCRAKGGYCENMYLLADEALYETKKNGRAGCTMIDENHNIMHRWRDDSISVKMRNALEYKNSGMFRMELPLDREKPRRLICGDDTKMIFGAPAEISPEECYERWNNGIDYEYYPMLQQAVEIVAKEGQAECTYLWQHPEWGKIYVRSNIFGEKKDDMIILSGYHHALKDANLIEKTNDKELIANALSDMFFGAYYWNLKENTHYVIKQAPGEVYLHARGEKTSDTLDEFINVLIASEDRQKVRRFLQVDTLQSRFEKERHLECEYRSLNVKGWCRLRLMPVKYDNEGILTNVLLTISLLDSEKAKELYDIDYNKRSLVALFNNVPGGIVMYEWDGTKLKNLHVSEYYTKEYGDALNRSSGENKGGPDFKRVHPDDLENYKKAIYEALTETNHLNYMFRVWNNNRNGYVWVKIDATAHPQPDGTSLVYAIYTDVTEQKDLELGLQKSQKSLTAALGASNQLCYEYDPISHSGICFTDTNFFGLPKHIENYPDSLKDIDLFHPDDVDTFIRTAHQMDDGRERAQCDARIKKEGEYCWYTCIFDAYYDPEREYQVAILTVVDISIRMAAMRTYEERLRSLLAMQGNVLSLCTINVTQNTFEMVNMEGILEGFVDNSQPFETVMMSVTDNIIGEEGRKAYIQTFNRKNLLSQAEKGNLHVQMEYLLKLSDNQYEWITAAVDMIKNPINGEIGGIAYSKSSQIEHMSNELLGRTLQQDYIFAAVIFKDTDEFYLYDSSTGEFSERIPDFWNRALTESHPHCSPETMEHIEKTLQKDRMLKLLDERGEYAYAYDSIYKGNECRVETKFRYLDEMKTMIMASQRNITDVRLMEQWRYDSEHDLLTGLLNRKTVFEKCREMLNENPQEQFVMLHCDIRHFHLYNTFFGDEAGDELLCKIGEIIGNMGDSFDYWTHGRIESDVFCAFFALKGDSFEKNMHYFFEELSGYSEDFPLEPAIGAYWVENPSMSIESMFSLATIAAKSHKVNLFDLISRYDKAMDDDLKETQQITNEMQSALNKEQFIVYLQPKFSLRSGRPIGAEALVRWNHPKRGLVPPAKFIPAFEKNGFITEMDRYMWEHVCRLLQKWKLEGRELFPVSVNISRVSMYSLTTVPFLKSLVEKYDIEPKYLELELTESAYMDDPEELKRMLRELQDYGFTILMDDFGNGYSSLNMLRELPVDVLKLDMRFLAEPGNDLRGCAVLSSIVRMSKLLNLPVIAEGVEYETQAEYLRSIGCDYVQGFLFARPMPVADFEDRVLVPSDIPEKQRRIEFARSQQDVLDSFTRMEIAGNTVPNPMAMIEYRDGQMIFLKVNKKFQKAFDSGCDEQSLNMVLREKLSTEDYGRMRRAFARCIESKEVVSFRMNWIDTDGDLHKYFVNASFEGELGKDKLLMVLFTEETENNLIK